MNNTLESNKFFPVVAWVLVVGFAVFTYSLTTRVQSDIGPVSDGIEHLEAQVEQNDLN